MIAKAKKRPRVSGVRRLFLAVAWANYGASKTDLERMIQCAAIVKRVGPLTASDLATQIPASAKTKRRISPKVLARNLQPAVSAGALVQVLRGKKGGKRAGCHPALYRLNEAALRDLAKQNPARPRLRYGRHEWGRRARALFAGVDWPKAVGLSHDDGERAAHFLVAIEQYPTASQRQLAELLRVSSNTIARYAAKLREVIKCANEGKKPWPNGPGARQLEYDAIKAWPRLTGTALVTVHDTHRHRRFSRKRISLRHLSPVQRQIIDAIDSKTHPLAGDKPVSKETVAASKIILGAIGDGWDESLNRLAGRIGCERGTLRRHISVMKKAGVINHKRGQGLRVNWQHLGEAVGVKTQVKIPADGEAATNGQATAAESATARKSDRGVGRPVKWQIFREFATKELDRNPALDSAALREKFRKLPENSGQLPPKGALRALVSDLKNKKVKPGS